MANSQPTEPRQEIQFRQLLGEAVTKPGTLMKAYSMFWNYSLGNQILALIQANQRGIPLGPIASFNRWKELNRYVKSGEKAIELCMPITMKRTVKEQQTNGTEGEMEITFKRFVFRYTSRGAAPVFAPCRALGAHRRYGVMKQGRLSAAGLLLATLLVAASVSVASGEQKLVNINTASVAELAGLNGIGDAKAKLIVDYREKNGPFKSVDDLRQVRGIGEKMVAKLRPAITTGQTAAVPAVAEH